MGKSPTPEEIIDALLDRIAQGIATADDVTQLKQLALNPMYMDYVMQGMKARGFDQLSATPTMSFDDYYVEGTEKFVQRWPLGVPLPLAFHDLDRKTQFSVLFTEWTRREMEGMEVLTHGDSDGAEATFQECLDRARQLGVRELEARSYEGMMRVEERRGRDREAQSFMQKAAAARGMS